MKVNDFLVSQVKIPFSLSLEKSNMVVVTEERRLFGRRGCDKSLVTTPLILQLMSNFQTAYIIFHRSVFKDECFSFPFAFYMLWLF